MTMNSPGERVAGRRIERVIDENRKQAGGNDGRDGYPFRSVACGSWPAEPWQLAQDALSLLKFIGCWPPVGDQYRDHPLVFI
jgi:hypothetical protein